MFIFYSASKDLTMGCGNALLDSGSRLDASITNGKMCVVNKHNRELFGFGL